MPGPQRRPDPSGAVASSWWRTGHVPEHVRGRAAGTTTQDGADRRSVRARAAAWKRLPAVQPAPASPATPQQRVLVASLALVIVVAMVASALLGWRLGLALASAAFFSFALGVAPALSLRLPDVASLVLASTALSTSTTVLIGLAMASSGTWAPVPAALWCAVVAVTWLAAHLVRDVRRARLATADRPPVDRVQLLSGAMALGGLAACLLDALGHRGDAPPGGLLVLVGPVWYLGAALLLASAVVATLRGGPAAVALPALALAVPVVASQAVAYGAPTVMAATRHVGVVEFVRAFHALDPTRDIYQSWAGLFAGTAWLADVGRVDDPVTSIATYFPVLSNATTVLAVRVLAGRLGLAPRRAWWAGAVFVLGNTLNTTYFSPQALGIFLALSLLALVLGAAPAVDDVDPAGSEPRGRATRLAAALRRSWPTALVALVLGSTLAVSHQISPYLLVVAMAVLFAFRVLRSWWPITAVLGPALVWAWVNRGWVGAYTSPGAFGDLFGNLRPPAAAFIGFPQPLSTRMAFDVPAAALVVIGLVALASWCWRRDRLAWVLALCAGSPLALAVGSDYGQEAIFRIALFALPWLALLAVRLPLRVRGRRAVEPVVALAVVVLLTANAVGTTGMDRARVVSRSTAEQMRSLELTAPSGAVVYSLGTGNATPARMTQRYFDVTYSVVDYRGEDAVITPDPGSQQEADAQVAAWTAQVRPECTAGCYVLQSVTVNAYLQRYGFQPLSAGALISEALATSPDWEAIHVGPTSTLYRLRAGEATP